MAAAEFRARKPIAFVGLMGAGKTSVGARIAERLGLPFADTDDEIERTTGSTIAEIFEQLGEEAFRSHEREIVTRLANGAPCVIATGGGAVADDQSRALLRERCTIVWLDACTETLADRVAGGRERPLLHGREARVVLADLAERRTPCYAQAHIRISAEPPIERVVADCLAALARHAQP